MISDALGMNSTPVSLLQRLRDRPDPADWTRFVHLVAPLLHYWARRTGLPVQDADDLVQDVFTILAKEMPRFEYDAARTFRGWLRTVALNQWNALRRKKQIPMQSLDAAAASSDYVAAAASGDDPGELLASAEFQQLLYQRAMQIMQADFPGNSWQACKAVVVDGRSAQEVAAELGMTVGAVHAARFRVLARLRDELAGMDD